MEQVINTIGRRKTAVARIYMKPGSGKITVNNRDYKEYFPTGPLQFIVNQAFQIVDAEGKWDVKANLDGGGITGQAEALRMAIARALCENNAEDRPALKAKSLLMRDPRMVERKKPGQPKARKRFQFSKR
ncbi:MAG: 30S ribosomal protein S9 [Bacteroidales bacterium]|jgi:small subunit ribosomal protein S9|nr:30S ribosomal protein S9 [Bacteroidales bacterium]MBQ6097057.1 30S ribosomal protein S9 [Bacteroidales bacterium]MBQ6238033.1 30S ribosomal protein S9 [Bacteroidales bacterium]MBQ6956212.1 30S ribosomal protein S9 [Bacteroidales bacterium]MBR3828209.1 30S ribosomal protein S9 [Bacteroidales bacterium]